MGHATMENRHRLAVNGMVTHATGTAERRASEIMLKARSKAAGRRITAGEDKSYDDGGVMRIVDFVLYDDLDPHALDNGIVRFDGRYFGELWDICRCRGLSVVADVHVHPGSAYLSESDRQYPMISVAGHVDLILPDFALGSVRARAVGIYRYLGGKRWNPVEPAVRHD